MMGRRKTQYQGLFIKEVLMYICEVCGKEYKTKRGLTNHMKTHETIETIAEDKVDRNPVIPQENAVCPNSPIYVS